jgi:hypothetical protein
VAAPPPAAAIDVAVSLQFGPVRAGTQVQQLLTIGNSGTAPLTISSVTSSDPVVFPLTLPVLPLTVPPAGHTTLTVGFAPTSETTYNKTLTITSNSQGNPTRIVGLSGTGALPHIFVSPAMLDLGGVFTCGITSLPKQVAIGNTGDVPLTVSSIAVGAPFGASPPNVTVPPRATKDVSVDFTPVAPGPAAGTLTLVSDDPANSTQTVALTGTGLPPQPPAVQVSPITFAFGNVRRQYFSAMEVTITNASACENLVVGSLTVTGTGFSLTDTLAVTGATILGPHNVPPNQTWKPLVVFAPTALGPATGTMTVTTNDPANPSLGPFPLSATGVDDAPAALELVLDRSGSMADPTPGGTKMADLQRTVALFAGVVIPGQGDEMGSVWFSFQAVPLTPFGSYDAAKQSQIKMDVSTLVPLGGTGIGAGLQLAQGQLGGSTVARRLILVFTDGIENLPPKIATVKPGIVGAGIEAYAVALGRPQDVSRAALSDLAWSSKGKFFQTEDALLLRKHFVQVLVDAFRQNVATDPVHTIQQGQTVTVPVSLTDCEHRVAFVLAWEDPSAQLGLEIQAPDGTVYTPTAASTNKLVRYGQDVGHRWYQVAFPPVDKPPGRILGPQRTGSWLMRVTGSQVSGTARFTATVLVDSDLDMDVRVAGSDTTKPLTLEVRLDEAGSRLTSATVKVRTTSPTKSVSEIYGPAALSQLLAPTVVDDLTGVSLLERASRTLRGRRYAIPTHTQRSTLAGTHGVYRLELPPPLVPGIYQFEIEVTGQACGGTFQRYASVSYYVNPVASPGTTGITVTAGPATTATVTVTPMTGAGQPLGPGLAPAIGGTVRGGRVESVVDRLDGSYMIRVRWSERTRSPVLNLDVGGARMKIPLTERTPRPRKRRSTQGRSAESESPESEG